MRKAHAVSWPHTKLLPLAVVWCGALHAQTAAPAEPATAGAYQDKLIEGQRSDDEDTQAALAKYDSTGWPRGYSLETVWDQRKSSVGRSQALGLKGNGYFDTPSYGSISAQGSAQNIGDQGTPSYAYVIRQIGMPFDGGWRADNAVGMLNLPSLDIARNSTRLSMPTPAMQGITSYWQQSQGLSILAAAGQTGKFGGYPVTGFQSTQGSYALVGAQQRNKVANGAWQWGGSLARARDVASSLAITSSGQGSLDAQAVYVAAGREWHPSNINAASAPGFIQINLLGGSNTGSGLNAQPNPAASGTWLDAGFSSAAHQHAMGIFYLEPGLAWLDQPMASDLQGAYWRHVWRTRQWSTESNMEILGSISGISARGFFANHSLRYQYSTGISMGGSVNIRRFGVDAQSALMFTQFRNPLGNARVQVELASASTGERQNKLQLEHDWSTTQGMRLSTALSIDQERKPMTVGYSTNRGVGLAINADWVLGQNLSFNQGLQGRRTQNTTQYSINSGLSWLIAPQWSLQATVYALTGNTSATALAQSPLLVSTQAATRTQDRGVFISVRYQQAAGRAIAPFGGLPGSAAGKLHGTVYFDENKNAKRDAAERGAANVTVLLNGRYAAQTDSQGRYHFEWVAAGNHVLTVISDNLPLPWQLEKDGRSEVKVYTRESTTLDIAATKP